MSNLIKNDNSLKADCENCFALCCVALPYAKCADFAHNKDGGTPCPNLQSDYRCSIHSNLRENGFRGCTVYECFGAGQKVSQVTFGGNDWRGSQTLAKEMFDVFPIMQQLHEMLYYLYEAIGLEETRSIYDELQTAIKKTENLTYLDSQSILDLDVPALRGRINELLLRTSELVRAKAPKNPKQNKCTKGKDLIGAKLKGADLRGSNLRGALLIAADLRQADLRWTDFIGADLRAVDLSGANVTGSLFLTQAQVNSANGDRHTKLPSSLRFPDHWLK
ncbi:pentapeptide repeat-containing protein [Bacillus sp. FJAT-29937]|uniref:pentapeptide repeat-containing protein n=1 Tax=Bacillus sp. FJAT-29937 TaxID=1720553 RepID=UPI00082A991E|nr:pentapeptide repeat-containing protein [Bacillus sp. FJAT-29937]